MDDTTEAERLRARILQLEVQQKAAEGTQVHAKRERTSVWWPAASTVLIVLACTLAPPSVASVWASNQLSDTEQCVATVAPLADDPTVQDALAIEVTNTVFESLDVEGVATDALETVAELENVPPSVAGVLPTPSVPLSNSVESFTRDQVVKFFANPQFAELWAVLGLALVAFLGTPAGAAVTIPSEAAVATPGVGVTTQLPQLEPHGAETEEALLGASESMTTPSRRVL